MTDDNSENGMIALLPTSSEWCNIELPHMTVVFLGPISGMSPGAFNELGKMASSVAMLTSSIGSKVLGTEVFGGRGYDDEVDVLLLEPNPQLKAVRSFFEMWDASEYDFRPHCTIGPTKGLTPQDLPMYLIFDRIMVAWGDESMIFWLKR